jgi:hypothetical protein
MRKREWERCTDPVAMLEQAAGWAKLSMDQPVLLSHRQSHLQELAEAARRLSVRRLRIFTLTAAEPALVRVNDPTCYSAANTFWRIIEGTASPNEVEACSGGLRAAWEEGIDRTREYFEAPADMWLLPRLINVLVLLLEHPYSAARHLIVPISLVYPGEPVPLLTPEETQNCCWLLREVFGDRGSSLVSPEWDDSWRTDTAVTLARQMYESGDLSTMPILADALQDAGCDNEDMLAHCRGPGPHLRRCWVLDAVLNR